MQGLLGLLVRVTEMGAPDAAVITSIGRAHIENMGSLEAIAAEAERTRPHLLVCYPSHLKQVAPALSAKEPGW